MTVALTGGPVLPASRMGRPRPIRVILAVTASVVATTGMYYVANDGAAAGWLLVCLFVAGVLLYRGLGLQYFLLAYAIANACVVLLAEQFSATNGSVFALAAGSDDRFFFEASSALAASLLRGDWSAVVDFARYSGSAFIVVGSCIQILLAPFGDPDPLAIRVVNAFVGSSIPVAFFVFARNIPALSGTKLAARISFILALFPTLIYYAASGYRDIWIAAGTAWFVVALRRLYEAPGSIWRWLAALGLTVAVGTFRPLSAVPLLLGGLCLMVGLRGGAGKLAMRLMLIGGLALAVDAYGEAYWLQYAMKADRYTELALSQAGSSSLGARILLMPSPASEIARFLLALYVPVPPFTGTSIRSMLIGIGALAWYMVIPFQVVGLILALARRDTLGKLVVGLSAVTLAQVGGIALTSIDVRHKVSVIGLGIFVALVGYSWLSVSARRWVLTLNLGVLGAMACAYVLLKMG